MFPWLQIQVTHRTRKGKAELLYCLTQDRASPNPLWLVTFQLTNVARASTKDLEIHEHSFGRILENETIPLTLGTISNNKKVVAIKSNSSESVTSQISENSATIDITDSHEGDGRSSRQIHYRKTDNRKRSKIPHEEEATVTVNPPSKRSRRNSNRYENIKVLPQQHNSTAENLFVKKEENKVVTQLKSSFPSTSNESRVQIQQNIDAVSSLATDRAQRSLRRQAKIEGEPSSSNDKSVETRKRVTCKQENISRKSDKSNVTSKKKSVNDEEVIKVKLNTGTLYLYRGVHRRAVFVRRF